MPREPKNVAVFIDNTRTGNLNKYFARRGARARLDVLAGTSRTIMITRSDLDIYRDQLLACIRETDGDGQVRPGGYIDYGTGEGYVNGPLIGITAGISLGEADLPLNKLTVIGDLSLTEARSLYCTELVVAGDLTLNTTGDFIVDELKVSGDMIVSKGTISTNIVSDVAVEGNLTVGAAAGLYATNISVEGNSSWAALSAVCTLVRPLLRGTTTLAATAGVVTMVDATLVGAITNPGSKITHQAVAYPT